MPELRPDSLLAEKIADHSPTSPPRSGTGSDRRREFPVVHLVAFLFLLLSLLRLKSFTLIDWDEGVFFLQGRWLATLGDAGKPFNFQTPPLYQLLAAGLNYFFPGQPHSLFIITVVFSTATLFLLHGLTRRLYSPATANQAVALFAVSEFFLFFSGSGLSDAVFVFFFWLALAFFLTGRTREQSRWLMAAGFCAVLALYTKYSGPALLIIFAVQAGLTRRDLNRRWWLWCLVLPLIFFLPYAFIYLAAVKPAGIAGRHASLFGLHHLSFLVHLAVFSPVLLILSAWSFFQLRNNDFLIAAIVLIYLLIAGFYQPYFRLAYPVIPGLAILASRALDRAPFGRRIILVAALALSTALGLQTIAYRTSVPRDIGAAVKRELTSSDTSYFLAWVPPNITAYLPAVILLPETHEAIRLGRYFPRWFKNRLIAARAQNRFTAQQRVLLLTAGFLPGRPDDYPLLLARGRLLAAWEFNDAPVYLKDFYNPLRHERLRYELYEFDLQCQPDLANQLWNLGFTPGNQILRWPD